MDALYFNAVDSYTKHAYYDRMEFNAIDSPLNASTLGPESVLPLVLHPASESRRQADELLNWLTRNTTTLDTMLLKHGGVLFRGFTIDSPEVFAQAIAASGGETLNYIEGQSDRTRVYDKIYTSTEYPAHYNITIHNELSYLSNPPQRLYFFCFIAPSQGGETPITDCRTLYKNLDPSIRDHFVDKQILYVKNMHDGRGLGKSWQAHFETEDRDKVEQWLSDNGTDFEWRSDGFLRTSQIRPAVINHPVTGEPVWFNQATLWHYSNYGEIGEEMLEMWGESALPTNAYFGDGTGIDPRDLELVRRQSMRDASLFSWQPGDLLILDNCLIAHGRKAYSGERRVLVAMS